MWSICSGRYHTIDKAALPHGAKSRLVALQLLQCDLFFRQCFNQYYVFTTSKKYKWNQYHRKRVQKLWEERLKIEEYNKKFLEDNAKFIPTDKKPLFRQDEFYYSDLDAS